MFARALATELLKLRRSRVVPATFATLALGPLGLALFMWIVREPTRAAKLGLLGTKANLSGLEATWPAFASASVLVVGMGGVLLLSFVVAYVFGREFAENTQKNLLALPVTRHWIALAKLVVAAIWWAALVLVTLVEAAVIGVLLGLPGGGAGVLAGMFAGGAQAALIAYLTVPLVAWATLAGRGYLPPLAFALVTLALGNVFGKTGWAIWFPWSIIPLLIGSVGKPISAVPLGSYAVLAATFVLGVLATLAQLRWADDVG
jgi:ABC-type transport system involved in multi-copper enzyme maturation permease subunit